MKERENILKKIGKVIRRVLAVGSAGLFLGLPSSQANESKQEKVEKSYEKEPTSFIDELKVDITTPTVEGELNKIIEQKNTTIKHENEKQEAITKPSKNNIINNSEKQQESITIKTKEQEEKTSGNTKRNETSKETYDQLLKKFNDSLDKKKVPDVSRKYFKAAFNNIYNNYDEWKQIGRDLPDKETFIKENVINMLDNVNNIHFYEENSKEAQERINAGKSIGAFTSTGNLIVIYGKNDTEEQIKKVAQIIIHEAAGHAESVETTFSDSYFVNYEYLKGDFVEGFASRIEQLGTELKTEKESTQFIKDGNYTLKYETNVGYPKSLYIVSNLENLVGFNTMKKVSEGKMSFDELKEIISRNYGKNTANTIFSELKTLNTAPDSKTRMEAATKLQKEFFKCRKQEIKQLKTKEEVSRYTNFYRAYKMMSVTQIYKDNQNITNEYYSEIEELDNILAEKIIETGAFKFSNNKEGNLKAIKTLLYTTIEDLNDEGLYMPVNLTNTDIKYINENLQMTYQNKTDYTPARKKTTIVLKTDKGKVTVVELEDNVR